MHEWGIWDDSPDYVALGALAGAYRRRKHWEWEQQAIHTVNALAKAMGGEGGSGPGPERAAGGPPVRRMSANQLMRSMGAAIED